MDIKQFLETVRAMRTAQRDRDAYKARSDRQKSEITIRSLSKLAGMLEERVDTFLSKDAKTGELFKQS